MLFYLGSGGHGDHFTRLFGGLKYFYDGQWLLAGGYFKRLLVKITNLLSKKNISFISNVDWKKKIHQQISSFARLTFAEWRSTFIDAEQMSFDDFIISRVKKDSNTVVFLWNLWNFQEQWWFLLKTRNIIT